MEQQLTTLYQNQEKLRNLWRLQKNKLFAGIYKGVLEHKTAKQIHQELYDLTINAKKPKELSQHAERGYKKLLVYAIYITNKAVKLDAGKGNYTNLDLLAIPLLKMFEKTAINHKANIIINEQIKETETQEKDKILDWTWSDSRKSGKIFYIASSHADSASDHKDYQGKIYVDRYWHNYDKDGSMGEYIRKHGIQTVQWVTGKPVWFVTRPYCRHYFRTYTWDEIKEGKYHIPKKKEGDRRLQTPAHATLEYYQDKLKELEALAAVRMTPLLRDKIEKVKILIAKWKSEAKKRF